MWQLRTKLEKRKDALRIGRQAEKWCRLNMGINNRKKYQPLITYYKSMDGDEDMGEYRYWDNEIIIYYNNTPTVKDFIRTIIHEWQHQLQPMSKYDSLDTAHGYDNNPLEVEADRAEERYYKQMWIDIKPKLNNGKYNRR